MKEDKKENDRGCAQAAVWDRNEHVMTHNETL